MNTENKETITPTDEELLLIAESVMKKYADALRELA